MRYPQKLKKVGVREYIYGDFDKDRVKNVDDPRPFDPEIKQYPNIDKNPRFYHKAQYGGTEVKLSTALLNIEKYNNAQRPFLKRFLRTQKNSSGRIKTVPSTIDKLSKRGITQLSDVSALTIETQNRKQAYQRASVLKKVYKTVPKQYSDYYRKPLFQHRALHLGLINPRGNNVEVQVKSSRFAALDRLAHGSYKRGRIPQKLIKRGQELYSKGY